MCDTLGRIHEYGAMFAKNSDRSPNEVQVLEFHKAKIGLSGQVECTYISVPQVERTNAVLLSRPTWMWGAEIGVNEHGLCIGNEAVFTKGSYGEPALTGMDLVRLALERSADAHQALQLIIELLQTYGQGGNCGYDHKFYYDNAFLIMDINTLYVLETAGKQWACKQYDRASISNRLTLGSDADAYAGNKPYDFKRRHTEPVFTTFSGSASRLSQTGKYLAQANTLQGCLAALRSHERGAKPFCAGSVSSACMHYGGAVGDHTTASMVVCLEKDRTVVWSTGSSLPCVSLFKPWLFGTQPVLPVVEAGDDAGVGYWMEAEHFRRGLLGKQIPQEYYEERNAIEQRWMCKAATVSNRDFPAFSRTCLEEETAFLKKWSEYPFREVSCTVGFRRRWEKKNKNLLHL